MLLSEEEEADLFLTNFFDFVLVADNFVFVVDADDDANND